jgi:hypothetical protein
MGLANVGNQTNVRFGGSDLVLGGALHIAESPMGHDYYVMTAAELTFLKGDLRSRAFTSLNTALNATTAGRYDRVFVCEGYTESIATANFWPNLKAGVRIIGLGRGATRPQLTWTTNLSTLLLNQPDVSIENCILGFEPTTGGVVVGAPIAVTASGNAIVGCRINTGTDATNKVNIAITCSAGASDFVFDSNQVRGGPLATMVTFLRLNGNSNVRVTQNDMICGTTAAAVGPVQVLTAGCPGLFIENNYIQNNAASSTACISVGLAGTTGWVANNKLRNMTDGSNAQIVVAGADVQLYNNSGVNNSNETGILLGTPSV